MAADSAPFSQCQRPTGWLGRLNLWRMNASHSRVTDWGLAHVPIDKHAMILDVGCGGGRTVDKLAEMATQGKIYGLDYSEESITVSKKTNARWIESGRHCRTRQSMDLRNWQKALNANLQETALPSEF
jgi:2-polyprenyl-3-methyl-5-hydroxy-6-metoxy-1,4-benzoquinol methylase